MNLSVSYADPGVGPIIKWTEGGEHPAQDALMDYVDAALDGAFSYMGGQFSTLEAYVIFKQRIRKEFVDRMMLITIEK